MNARFNKIWKTVWISFVTIFCIAILPISAFSGEKVYKIGIATIATHPALDAARQGFIDTLKKAGYVEGKNVIYDMTNAEGDMSLAASIAKKFVSQRKDMILAITTPIAQAMVGAAKYSDIPIIFNSVTDPVAAGIVNSWKRPGGKVTGASDWMDVEHQVKIMMRIAPNIKRVGVIYNAGEVNSRVQVAELKKVAKKLGIKKIVERNVSTTADVLITAKSMVSEVDAYWFPTDNIVVAALEAVVKIGEDYNKPVFGSDPNHPLRGVIAAAGVSMYDVGVESGKMAVRVLQGEKPGNIAVTKGVMSKLTVNLAAAERMGVTIPKSILREATEILYK